jgi:hypothetical protein
MKVLSLGLLLAVGLLVIARDAAAQASAMAAEQETLENGVLVIELQCTAAGDFDPGDGTEDYAGVSVGDASEKGCMLISPSRSSQYGTSDADYYETETVFLPVINSGDWQYYASFYLWFWPCDSDCVADNGQTYSYDDPWGFTAYAGDPTRCTLGDICYGPFSGDGGYLTDYYNMAYVYVGNSWANPESLYVDALAIDISPGSYSLDASGQVTFTAGASNTANFLPFYQWTLVSGPGSGAPSGSSDQDYTYTAPSQVSPGNTTATIKGCVTNLTTTPVCQTVTVDLIPETINIETPSPQTIPADGASTSYLYADIGNGSPNASVDWTPTCATPPSGTVCPSGNTTGTYMAASATSVSFGQSPQASVGITGCIHGASPAICGPASITLVQPVSISGVTPTTLIAGTTIQVTINGAGFGPLNSTPSVAFSSTSWGSITSNSGCSVTIVNATIVCPSVTIPANLSNMTGTQPVTITVSTTTAGITTQATYSVNVTPIAYTYGISLLPNTSSVTYGSSSTITPVVTCKVATTGAACAGNVSNPQDANFSVINGIGLGSLSNTTNAASTVFTDTALIGYPAQNATVQGCASIAPTVCATTNFSIPATAITLNPASMSGPMTAGRTQPFTASIQNEGTANSLTCTLAPSPPSAAPGTLTSATTTITQQGSPASGTSGPNTYTAPNPITAAAVVTLNVCMTANASICATPIAIQLPGFSITATNNNPSQTALSLGHSMSYTVNVSALYGFTGPVTLTASGLPAGVTATFSPASITTSGSATLTLTSAYSASTYLGSTTVAVTGTSGSTTVPTTFNLTTRSLQYPCPI